MSESDSPSADLLCPWCGYNLRGLSAGRCPECGRSADPATLSASLVPWSNRRHIGTMRAFARTCYIATFHSDRLASCIHVDLSRRSAKGFFALCLMALLPGFAAGLLSLDWATVIDHLTAGWPFAPGLGLIRQYLAPWTIAMDFAALPMLVGMLTCAAILLAPVRATQFSRTTTEVRERLITAAYYLSGAWLGGLICAALGAAPLFAGALAYGVPTANALRACLMFAVAFAGALWLISCARFARQASVLTGLSQLGYWVAFPIALLVNILLWIVAVPFTIGFVWIAISSI